jgi:hypothetical protein
MRLLLGVAILALVTMSGPKLVHAMPAMGLPAPASQLLIERVRNYCKPERVCDSAHKCTKFLQCYTCKNVRVCMSADGQHKCKLVEECKKAN